MPANPKAQLTKLTLGIAGVAAVATVAGRFAATPVNAATTAENTQQVAPSTTEGQAPEQGFFSWLGGGHDDDDDEEHEEAEHHGRERGRMQFAQPGTGSTSIAPSTGTQQAAPRSRTRKS